MLPNLGESDHEVFIRERECEKFSTDTHLTSREICVFENTVVVIFLNIFYIKIYQNDIFLFLKNYS
jgi:hypothetical protein